MTGTAVLVFRNEKTRKNGFSAFRAGTYRISVLRSDPFFRDGAFSVSGTADPKEHAERGKDQEESDGKIEMVRRERVARIQSEENDDRGIEHGPGSDGDRIEQSFGRTFSQLQEKREPESE
jgi:hypothetical protein